MEDPLNSDHLRAFRLKRSQLAGTAVNPHQQTILKAILRQKGSEILPPPPIAPRTKKASCS
jgi:hypothetical protein